MNGTAQTLAALSQLVAERLASRPDVSKLALTKNEAARSLGVSVDHLERHVLPELRVIRSGRRVLSPSSELERSVDEHAAYAFGVVA